MTLLKLCKVPVTSFIGSNVISVRQMLQRSPGYYPPSLTVFWVEIVYKSLPLNRQPCMLGIPGFPSHRLCERKVLCASYTYQKEAYERIRVSVWLHVITSLKVHSKEHVFVQIAVFSFWVKGKSWVILHLGISGINNLPSIHSPVTIVSFLILPSFATEALPLVCSSALS